MDYNAGKHREQHHHTVKYFEEQIAQLSRQGATIQVSGLKAERDMVNA